MKLAVALFTFLVVISALNALLIAQAQQAGKRSLSGPSRAVRRATAGKPSLEMVFVLDTTGSMSGLIEGAKQRIWGIVNDVMQLPSRPNVRIGLVADRDRGDEYVTQVLPLTDDLDRVYSTLMDYRANGGGDGPENVRRALAEGIGQAGWSARSRMHEPVAQIVFLVGDAPPHDDYEDEPDTLQTTQRAVERGMIVNTIQCGDQSDTRQIWQNIARRGEGQYFAIAQDGGVESITSPFDAKLSELGTRLGNTFTAYGGGAGAEGARFRAAASARQLSMESKVASDAPAPAQAERAMNKALNSVAYSGDLLQSIENDSVKLEAVKDEDLPDDLRKLSPAARKQEVERRLAERRRIRAEIVALAKQRDAYLAAERKKRSTSQQGGFDVAVAKALKEQLARKGIR